MKISRILAVGATVALVGASAAFVGQSADAAAPTDSYVTASQFTMETSPYSQGWFKGSVAPATMGTLTSTPGGLSITGGVTQILDGTTPTTGLVNLASTARLSVNSGLATFQIPLFADGTNNTGYTTLRPVATNSTSAGASDMWITSQAIAANNTTGNNTAYAAGATASLPDFEAALGTDYKILAFGAYVRAADSAVITSITWNGSTSWFTPQPTAVATPTTISQSDFMNASKGVTVHFTGFVPGEKVNAGMGAGQRGGDTGQSAIADANGDVTITFVGANNGPVGTIGAGSYSLGAYSASAISVFTTITVTADPAAAAAPAAPVAVPVTTNASFTG